MEYPRTVVLENDKLKELLIQKGELINAGRGKSERVEQLEAEMQKIDEKIQKIEDEVDITDLSVYANEVTKKFNKVVKEMDGVKQQIYDRMKDKVPKSLTDSYKKAKKAKEEMEIERNKVALKVQKFNDKLIPMARKVMAPFLENSYEDFNSLEIKDGKVIGTIFSHLDEFETNFKKKNGI